MPKHLSHRSDPTQRFSNRVNNYVRYRPRYPKSILTTLTQACGLTQHAAIADLGSGTGFLSELFLANGNSVWAVEPNAEMRTAAEVLLKQVPQFHSVSGRAEATTLAEQSVDFVVAGQAFHWFSRDRTRQECLRILRPQGWVVLIWNKRKTTATPFLVTYEQLLQQYAVDYSEVTQRQEAAADLDRFYGLGQFTQRTFDHQQTFDWLGLKGRLLSSSYMPDINHPNYQPTLTALAEVFADFAVDGKVQFLYETQMYFGRLTAELISS